MTDSDGQRKRNNGGASRGFLTTFFASLARDFLQMLMAFLIGIGGGAFVCWYYGLPLPLAVLGGILVLGLAVALKTDSWFD